MTHIVYLAINTENAAEYVGITCGTLNRRRVQHERDAASGRHFCRVFHAAICKYGPEAFEWTIIAEFEDRAEAIAREIAEIAMREPTYNIMPGGQGFPVGWKQSPEHIAKRAASQRGKKASEAARAKMRGRVYGPEIQAKRWASIRANGPHPKVTAALAALHASLRKPVVCVDTGTVFPDAVAAGIAHGLPRPTVSYLCVRGHRSRDAFVRFRYAIPTERDMANVYEKAA